MALLRNLDLLDHDFLNTATNILFKINQTGKKEIYTFALTVRQAAVIFFKFFLYALHFLCSISYAQRFSSALIISLHITYAFCI